MGNDQSVTQQNQPNARSRPWILHPFLFSAFPQLALYSHNPGGVMLWELGLALGVALTAALVLLVVLRVIYANWYRAALGTSWCLLLFYSYWFTAKLNPFIAKFSDFQLTPNMIFGLWIIILLVGLAWLWRPREDDIAFTRFANLFGMAVVFGPIVLLGNALYKAPHLIEWEPMETPLAEEIALTKPETDSGQTPDIYYLVFDRYGDADTLQNDFDYDNRPFLQELEDRGFYVATQTRANYPKTDLSMSSALNMRFHDDEIRPKSFYFEQLQDHRVGLLLQEQGYRYHHLGGLLDGLRWNRNADFNYRFSPMPTEYTDILLQFTPLHRWLSTTGNRGRTLEKFEMLAEKDESAEPKFVYAHFVTPHEPWKFDQDGEKVTAAQAEERGDIANYRNQLIYTNRRILETIDQIRANSSQPPIIIIQADEGPELVYENDEEKTELQQIRKRTGIISAFSMPGKDAATAVPATVSPVNTFRIIFREYFNADIELLPDRTFYWDHPNEIGKPDHTRPGQFVDVTEKLKKDLADQ